MQEPCIAILLILNLHPGMFVDPLVNDLLVRTGRRRSDPRRYTEIRIQARRRA